MQQESNRPRHAEPGPIRSQSLSGGGISAGPNLSQGTAYDRIIEALQQRGQRVRTNGSRKAKVQCPCHESVSKSSLSVTGIEGQALLHCFAGCQTQDIVAALGLDMRDLYDNPKDTAYHYDDGRTAHRTWDKRFWQTGNKERFTLYRLDVVKLAVLAGKTVWLVEGEKDVHAIESLGEVGTTGPQGADSIGKVDLTPLHGADIIAIPDRDEAGAKWAWQVHDKLRGVAASLVFKQAKVGKDAADHIAAGHGLEDFEDIAVEHIEVEEQLDYAAVFAEEVEREARKMRVREAAQRKIRREHQRDVGNLDSIPLDRFLAIPDEPVDYRTAGLWPSGGRIVLAAQWKVGKTTLTGNVIRALADGALFLNRFQTQPAEVTLLDFEMDPRKIRQWLRDQKIKYASHVHVVALRGKVSSFDILDPVTRSQWAARIRGSDVVIFDCLRPILDALGLDENRDAGRLLLAIDELLNEAQVPEALIVHHMGHSGERSRGDSRIIDWPDATWKLVRENPDVESSARYFSAYGRDVYQAESLLEFNPETRRLALVGGNRKDASNIRLLEPLLEILRGSEDGMSGRQLDDAMVDAGHGRNASREARQYAVKNGQVITTPGKARAVIHKLPTEGAPVRHGAPVEVAHHASESGGECASAPIEGARTPTTQAPGVNTETAPPPGPEQAASLARHPDHLDCACGKPLTTPVQRQNGRCNRCQVQHQAELRRTA